MQHYFGIFNNSIFWDSTDIPLMTNHPKNRRSIICAKRAFKEHLRILSQLTQNVGRLTLMQKAAFDLELR